MTTIKELQVTVMHFSPLIQGQTRHAGSCSSIWSTNGLPRIFNTFISMAKWPCAKVPNVQEVAKSACILNIRFALLTSCRFSPRFYVCTVMYSSSCGGHTEKSIFNTDLFTRGRYKQKSRSDRNVARILLNSFASSFLTNIVNPPVRILKFPNVLFNVLLYVSTFAFYCIFRKKIS